MHNTHSRALCWVGQVLVKSTWQFDFSLCSNLCPSFLSQVLLSNKPLASQPLSWCLLLDNPVADPYTTVNLSIFTRIQPRHCNSPWLWQGTYEEYIGRSRSHSAAGGPTQTPVSQIPWYSFKPRKQIPGFQWLCSTEFPTSKLRFPQISFPNI